MIKQLIIFVFVGGFLLIEGFAQSSGFMKTYGSSEKDNGFDFIRTCDNGYVLAGTSNAYDDSNDVLLIKIDSLGNEKWAYNICLSGFADYPICLLEMPDSSVSLYISSEASNVAARLIKFDYAGIVVLDSTYYISNGFPAIHIQGGVLLPNGEVVTPSILNDTLFIAYWWNQDGDTLFSKKIDTYNVVPFFSDKISGANVIIKNDTLVFYMDNAEFPNKSKLDIIQTNLSGDTFSFSSHYDNLSFFAKLNRVEDNRFLIASNNIYSSSIRYYFYNDTNDSIMNENIYSNALFDISGIGCDVYSENEIFLCGRAFYNADSSKAHIIKFDSLGHNSWLKLYQMPGYNYSYLYKVSVYSDCIVAIGTTSNSNVMDSVDILFVKADLNGNATSITTFEKPDNTLTVFPNPASDLISVNLLPEGESAYTIVDAGGRELLKGKTQSNQISISSLPAGCYQLLWENDGKMYHAGFVKE